MDPFLDLIHLLRPSATLWAGIEGTGPWGVAFRKRDDVLFCWVQRGECQLIRPRHIPVRLAPNDFLLVRTSTPFTLTSDPSVAAEDSETLVAATGNNRMIVGEGTDSPVTLRGGRFVFDTANEHLLTGLLPSLVHVPAQNRASARLRCLLAMNETESLAPGPGSDFVITRLMELILVEILRSNATHRDPDEKQGAPGLLAGLAHPVTSCALSAMHRDVAHGWTVSTLARLCGVSRSTLASRFRHIVGTGPIEYLSDWRLALAKDHLRGGTRSISEIAFAVGFQSSSAFSTAFTRSVGASPRRFAITARQHRSEARKDLTPP